MVIQGDLSGCSLGFVDIKIKVAFQYMLLTIKRNFCFDVENTLGTTVNYLMGHPVRTPQGPDSIHKISKEPKNGPIMDSKDAHVAIF